jgi:predicted peptidase
MRKTFLYLTAFLLITGVFSSCRKNILPNLGGGGGHAPAPVPQFDETDPPILTPVTKTISPNILGFYQALPSHYHESKETYPLMIYFHGGGQYGNGASDLYKVLQEGVPKLLNEKKFPPTFTVDGKKHSFIVISPQFVKKVNNAEIDALIKYVKQNYRVNISRIYLAGFSLGGRMLCDYAAYKPADIAAITAMGGISGIDHTLAGKCEAMAKSNLPVWQFHNRDDMAWYYSEAKRFNEVLRSYNAPIAPKFTTFDVGTGRLHHDCWTRTTNPAYKEGGKNIYEWMLSYTR